MEKLHLTWEQIKSEETGAILHDVFDEGVRFIIMRGPSSLCAYVGVPIDHPLSGHHYDDLPVSAHGGLTFAGESDELRPSGFYWYGWDYAHSGDYSFHDDVALPASLRVGCRKWLVDDVAEDSWNTLYDFKKLMRLAEGIRRQKAETS